MMTRLARAFAATALLIPLLAACGGSDDVAYVPAAFGEDGKCYYVEDADEVRVLRDDDLCERSWTPTPAPPYWLFLYMPYFSSPAYYDRYVPAQRRSGWQTRSTTFTQQNKTQIDAAQKTAKYRGSDGKTYTGAKVKPGQFGSGNKGFGNGTRKCSLGHGDGRIILGATAPRPPAPRPAPARPNTNKAPAKAPGAGTGKTGGC